MPEEVLFFWHPKGAEIRGKIKDFWKDEHIENGHEIVNTPHIANIGP